MKIRSRYLSALFVNVALPWLAYRLALPHWGPAWALAASALPLILWMAWDLARLRHFRAFAPVFDERDDANLPVQGEIPKGLQGVFMRNGPNPEFKPDARYAYPFDGTGMIHAIYLENGQARYRNRWVMTQELAKEQAAGQRLYNSNFSAPPHANLANTNIVHHAGRYLALYEGGAPYAMDREINTAGLFNYDGELPGVMSAHPKSELWQSPEFLRTNYVITAAWAVAFAVMVVADLALVYLRDLPRSIAIFATVAALYGAVKFTGWYPERGRGRLRGGLSRAP